jgi:hypothetical protein
MFYPTGGALLPRLLILTLGIGQTAKDSWNFLAATAIDDIRLYAARCYGNPNSLPHSFPK